MSPANKQAAHLKKKDAPSISYKWINWTLPIIVFCTVLFFAQEHLSKPNTLPVNKIRVHGEFVNVDEAMLHLAVTNVVAGGYFNVDVGKVREVVEKLAWVSEASVRRVWPDTLSVSIVEQKPIAVSKEAGLINASGDVFKPEKKISVATLPVFEGEQKLNKLMLSKYHKINSLLETIDKKIVFLKLDARHALELTLNNSLKIVLGRDDAIKRLERFILIYDKVLAKHAADIDFIDLRYTNGMAVSWKKNLKNSKGMLGDTKHV